MKILCLPVLCLGLISLNDCNSNAVNGSGVARTETRTVAGFSKIDLVGSPDVDVTVGPETSVSVTTDDNILPLIETTVSGDTLKIDSKGSFNSRIGPTVKITAPSLDDVSISGSGNVSVTDLKGEVLEARITGSGNITLTGDVDRLSATITGSGDIKAGRLSAKNVRVHIAGSGNATVQAAEELDASVAGSGDVHYLGNPPQVHKSITGSGDISAR